MSWPNEQGDWECSICLDEIPGTSGRKPIFYDDYPLCTRCIRVDFSKRFEQALKNEFQPARWGSRLLDARRWRQYLDPDLVRRWEETAGERFTEVGKRVYCRHWVEEQGSGEKKGLEEGVKGVEIKDGEGDGERDGAAEKKRVECGTFLGPLATSSTPTFTTCPSCTQPVCLTCRAAPAPSEKENHTVCDPVSPTDGASQKFSGMKRGRDYQLCPRCHFAVERQGICRQGLSNQMECAAASASCTAEFCFFCGEEANWDDGHWRGPDRCPHHRHPADGNAQYARSPLPDSDDEEGEGEGKENRSYEEEDEEDRGPDDRFISHAEQDARKAYPNDAHPDIDAFLVDNELAEAALPTDVLKAAAFLRWKYFDEWHERKGRYGFRPRQWGAPAEVMRAVVLCYRILCLRAEMHQPPEGWSAKAALERHRGFWAELNALRPTLPAEWKRGRVEDLLKRIQVAEENDAEVVEKLEALAAQEGAAST